MKVFREIHDFITGGSIVAPIGLCIALGLAFLTQGIVSPVRAGIFLAALALTFVATMFEPSL